MVFLTCKKCGFVDRENVAFDANPQWEDNIWLKMTKKSVHKRNKWMKKKLRGLIDDQYIPLITEDFLQVVEVMKNKKLIKGKNLSSYNYIIRLC